MEKPVQPDQYKTEQELVNWLIVDLEYQRSIGVAENELTLNIGTVENNNQGLVICEVNFSVIIKKLLDYPQTDENGYIICPFKLSLIQVDFVNDVDFTKIVFDKGIECIYAQFHSFASFYNSIFKGDVFFSNLSFNKKVCFNDSLFEAVTSFKQNRFNDDVSFKEAVFDGNADFDNSIFSGLTQFVSIVFNGVTSFVDVTFNGKADLSQSTFNDVVSFSQSMFVEDIEFIGSTFKNKAYFLNMKLKKIMYFNNIKLNNDNSNIIFENINYDCGKKIINEEYYKSSKIEIINTVIDGRIDFNNVAINRIDFKGSSVINSGVISRVNFEAEPENSDTARFLKHEELTRSNTIKALEYKAKEKELYYIEIKTRIIAKYKKKNYKDDKRDDKNIFELSAELFSILLSKCSNNHGQNWIQAVVFTFVSGFLFFIIAYKSVYNDNAFIFFLYFSFSLFVPVCLFVFSNPKNNNIEQFYYKIISLGMSMLLMLFFILVELPLVDGFPLINGLFFMRDYFSYLIPVNFDLMICVSDSIGSDVSECNSQFNYLQRSSLSIFYSSYFLGKIFVGYGIFQVIQAFRKFNIK